MNTKTSNNKLPIAVLVASAGLFIAQLVLVFTNPLRETTLFDYPARGFLYLIPFIPPIMAVYAAFSMSRSRELQGTDVPQGAVPHIRLWQQPCPT